MILQISLSSQKSFKEINYIDIEEPLFQPHLHPLETPLLRSEQGSPSFLLMSLPAFLLAQLHSFVVPSYLQNHSVPGCPHGDTNWDSGRWSLLSFLPCILVSPDLLVVLLQPAVWTPSAKLTSGTSSQYKTRLTLVLSCSPIQPFLLDHLHCFLTPTNVPKCSLPESPQPPHLPRSQTQQQQPKNRIPTQQT